VIVIVATIILIAITVVAGGFICTYVSGMLRSSATSQQASSQSYFLIPSSGDNATLTVTVQDSGTVAISGASITSLNNVPTLPGGPFLGSIAPGSTMSSTATINGIAPFLVSYTYTATFKVTYANGVTQDITEGLAASTF
jgi:FlaG/FlaF family flagellin (archaellin)